MSWIKNRVIRGTLKQPIQNLHHQEKSWGGAAERVYVAKIGKGPEKPLCCSLGHEWLHWFHSLRNPVRFASDRTGDRLIGDIINKNSTVFGWIFSACLNKGVNSVDHVRKINISLSNWRVKEDKMPSSTKAPTLSDLSKYSQEEHLTICGAPESLIMSTCPTSEDSFQFGDEHSENRIIVDYNKYMTPDVTIPLRASHSEFAYFEDVSVIKKILELCNGDKDKYLTRSNEISKTTKDFCVKGLGSSLFSRNNLSPRLYGVSRRSSDPSIYRKSTI